MNAIHKIDNGMRLDYGDPGARRAHHAERLKHASDRERCAVITAERELLVLAIVAEHLDLSEVALMRIDQALARIRFSLALGRRRLGMRSALREDAV